MAKKLRFQELPDFNVPTGTPFRRAMIVQERVRRITEQAPSAVVRSALLAQVVYEGRGHGQHKNSGFTLAKQARLNRSKYQPHQGKREIARRAAR